MFFLIVPFFISAASFPSVQLGFLNFLHLEMCLLGVSIKATLLWSKNEVSQRSTLRDLNPQPPEVRLASWHSNRSASTAAQVYTQLLQI